MPDLFVRIARILQSISTKPRGLLQYLSKVIAALRSAFGKVCESHPVDHGMHQQQEQDTIKPKLCTTYLTASEADQVQEQFKKADNGRKLLFWTNVPRALAQEWANANGANTLSDMMGPLMIKIDGSRKSKEKTRYIHGVSCLFAEFAGQKASVIVLTTAPGVARHRPESTYLDLEEPILRNSPGLRMDYVHPTVQGAEVVEYSRWPVDNTPLWLQRFGEEKQIDPVALYEMLRGGQKSPHFSVEQLPSLRNEVYSENLLLSRDELSISKIEDPCMTSAPVECYSTRNRRWEHVTTQTLQVDAEQECIPEKSTSALVKSANKQQEQKNTSTKTERILASATAGPSVTPSLIPPPALPQMEMLNYPNRKELIRQLGFYTAWLDRHCKQTRQSPVFQVQKPKSQSSKTVVTLFYNGAKFKAQAVGQKLARRLAAQQAYNHFNTI